MSILFQERDRKLAECDKLRMEIHRLSKMPNTFDALSEYRQWWDSLDIDSETDDGWPKDFCFEYENIWKFVEYWTGEKQIEN